MAPDSMKNLGFQDLQKSQASQSEPEKQGSGVASDSNKT